jgi:hypothetical protein
MQSAWLASDNIRSPVRSEGTLKKRPSPVKVIISFALSKSHTRSVQSREIATARVRSTISSCSICARLAMK